MREKRTVQHSLFHFFADHEIGKELQAMSNWLDDHPEILDWVEADLQPLPVIDCGRKGLPVESGIALCDSQAVSASELRRVGILSG
jgi:transposase, IS5 family